MAQGRRDARQVERATLAASRRLQRPARAQHWRHGHRWRHNNNNNLRRLVIHVVVVVVVVASQSARQQQGLAQHGARHSRGERERPQRRMRCNSHSSNSNSNDAAQERHVQQQPGRVLQRHFGRRDRRQTRRHCAQRDGAQELPARRHPAAQARAPVVRRCGLLLDARLRRAQHTTSSNNRREQQGECGGGGGGGRAGPRSLGRRLVSRRLVQGAHLCQVAVRRRHFIPASTTPAAAATAAATSAQHGLHMQEFAHSLAQVDTPAAAAAAAAAATINATTAAAAA